LSSRSPAIATPLPCPQDATTSSHPKVEFADLYHTYFAFVWRTVRRLGIPAASADDLTQEVFIVAHRRLRDFQWRSTLKTWLFGIVANIVRAHRRAVALRGANDLSQSVTNLETSPPAEAFQAPDDTALRAEATAIVDGLLDELSEQKREVFVLAELEQMAAPDISVALGIPLNTVYSRLRLARKAFADAARRYRAREKGRLL
jgi:RNA polymerase sigma-70 factor (ECF subfamily)